MKPALRTKPSLILYAALASTLTLFCAPQETSRKEDEPAKDVVIEGIETIYRFENDGTGETVQRARVRILTEAGRKGMGQVYFPYSNQTEDLRIDYFRTVKPNGETVAADLGKAMDMTSPVSQVAPTFTDLKLKAMVASSLLVGDALEYQTTKTLRAPLKAGDFWVLHFATRHLIVQSEIVKLDVPADRPLAFKSEQGVAYQTEQKAGRKVYRWETSNPKPTDSDDSPQQPLFCASTFAAWKEVGEWYVGLQSGRGEATPEILALADQLTAGKAKAREKLEAIYAYVSKSIRYVNLSFGIGGFQAHPAAEVLRNGYGDCKDKHGFLAALLAAAGLEAYPVLVNSERGVIEAAVPMPSQFNHVMSAIPVEGELLWMDTTIELAPLGLLPKAIRGKQALLIQPGATRLAEIPAQSPVLDQTTLATAGKLDAAGKLTLENQLGVRGMMEVPYRQIYRLGNKQAIDTMIKLLGASQEFEATTEATTNSDPTDLAQPFEVRYKLTKPDFLGPLERSKEVSVPHVLIGTRSWDESLEKAKKRRTATSAPAQEDAKKKVEDLDLGGPGKTEETLDLELDPIYQVDLPLPVRIERSFATYESAYGFDQGHLRARRTLTLKEGKLPPDRWQELDSFVKLMDRDLDQKLTLRRTGKVDLLSRADQMTADELNSVAATLLDEGKELSLARDLLLKATAKDPQHKWAWNNLGRAYASLASYSEAEKAYKKQIEINPNDEYTYINLGWIYATQKRYDDAVAAYRKQIEINPLDKDLYDYLGWTLGQMGKWDGAAEAYAKSAALNREKPSVYATWGNALLKAGRTDDARKQFERALSLDSGPTMLNDVAYMLAEAAVDLDRAEPQAKQAVEAATQTLAGPLSLDVPPDYTPRLRTLGAYLDTLGWVYFQQGKLEEAEALLLTAYLLQGNSVVAEHIARVYARQDKFDAAVRYYAYSQMSTGWTGRSARELEDYLTQKAGGSVPLKTRANEMRKTFGDQHLVSATGSPWSWPPDTTLTKPVFVELAVLVDVAGAVTDVQVLEGDERFRETALADARRLRLPPLAWPGHSLTTVRTISLLYAPPSTASSEKRVKVLWGLGKPPAGNVTMVTPDGEHLVSMPAGLVAGAEKADLPGAAAGSVAGAPLPEYLNAMTLGSILLRGLDLEGAIGKFRQAILLEPNCAVCHRALADTLAQKGERAAAIAEYEEVVRVEPDNPDHHFMLGAQFEAQAATEAYAGYQFDPKTHTGRPRSSNLPKSARADYESALEQYRMAYQLAPGNTSYKEACSRVQQQLTHR